MNCAQFEWQVVDIAAGRGDAGAEVRAHVARCERCRARLDAERRLSAGLRNLTASMAGLSAPPRIEQALLAQLRAKPQAQPALAPSGGGGRRRWRHWPQRALRGAIVASVLALLNVVVVNASREAALPAGAVAGVSPAEVATPFYPVYMTGAAVAGARGVVRVRVPRATLAVFGLPYNPRRATDPISADLVVDNGGVVTALRFVQ